MVRGRILFFNKDVEDEGDPVPVRDLKERVCEADAVLIAAPEYDYAIPGVPTTALDWVLRPPSPLRHKPVGIVGASPGRVGTARGQIVLYQILLHAPAYVMPEPQILIMSEPGDFGSHIGGCLTQWHAHSRLLGWITPEMMHVWTADVPGGPFSELRPRKFVRLLEDSS